MTSAVGGAIGAALDLGRPLPCLVQAEACSYSGTDVEPVGAGPSVDGLADRIDMAMLMAMGAVGISIMIAVGAILLAVMLLRSQRDQYLLPVGPRVRRLDDERPAVSPNPPAVHTGGSIPVPALAEPPRPHWG